MTEPRTCPSCGAPLDAAAPHAPCPACLMKLGMDSWAKQKTIQPTLESPLGGGTFVPPKPDELAARFPQFEILDLLGVGGMGAVYKARQKSLNRLVAIKIIKPDAVGSAGFAERFKREAHSLARLNHPHIIAVYDFGQTEEGLFFLVMEYVDGTNLRRLIESQELRPERAIEIIPQICEALQFAHDDGIVHRDIKPENILVDTRGRVKIADFGLAKIVEINEPDYAITGTHQVMGTPRYMAPEQMEGAKAVDHRADIYSLGVVFYEMLTGQLPLGRFDPPSQCGSVGAEWDQVIMRTLEKEPGRRFQSADDVKTEIQRLSDVDRPPVREAGPDTAKIAADDTQPHTAPHYGKLALGATMLAVGIAAFVLSTLPGCRVFVWVGIGIALGGGGCCSGAFHDKSRLPRGTKPNPGELVLGGIMVLIGATVFAYGLWMGPMGPGNVWFWVAIGLTIGGGGCFESAWKKPRQLAGGPASQEPPHKRDPVADAPARFTAGLAVAWIAFTLLHGVITSLSPHSANQLVSWVLWLLWSVVTPTMICGLVVWIAQRRRGIRYPVHPGDWFWNMQALSGAAFLLLQTLVFITQILETNGVFEASRVTDTARFGVLIPITLFHISMAVFAVFFQREWRWRLYLMAFVLGMSGRVVAYASLIAALWTARSGTFATVSAVANIFCVLPLLPLVLVIIADWVAGCRRPWTHWVGVTLQIMLHLFTLAYVVLAFA